jgi:hypothetical protein
MAFTTGPGLVADEVPDIRCGTSFRLLHDPPELRHATERRDEELRERVPLLDARFFVNPRC